MLRKNSIFVTQMFSMYGRTFFLSHPEELIAPLKSSLLPRCPKLLAYKDHLPSVLTTMCGLFRAKKSGRYTRRFASGHSFFVDYA